MKTEFTYLRKRFNEDQIIYAIENDRISTMYVHDTYNDNGQKNNEYDSNDYSVCNSASELKDLCENAIAEKFNIDVNDFELDDLTIDYFGDEEVDEKEINNFIEEYEKENAVYTELEGFNYWDCRNWKTVVTSTEYGEPNYEIIDNEELIVKFEAAIKDRSFIEEKTGKRIFKGNGYYVINNSWSDSFACWELMSEEDYEIMNQ